MENNKVRQYQMVERFNKLNLSTNKELNDQILLAVNICNVPIVLITLLNADTQVIKCKIGLDIDQTTREDSFCRYLALDEVMVVPDTRKDKRFRNNPAVTGELAIRFYAGAALVTSGGLQIGSFCIADHKPQSFSKYQKELLAIIARQVMCMMELELSYALIKKNNLALKAQKEKTAASARKLRGFFNSSSAAHTLIDSNFIILDFNKGTELYIHNFHQKQVKKGRNIKFYINALYHKKFDKYFNRALNGIRTDQVFLLRNNQEKVWWEISFQPILDKTNKVVNVAFSATNVDERKKQTAELVRQNKSLIEVAYIQSHAYRKPVTSILGLMNIIKDANYEPDKECMHMMGTAIEDLDFKLRKAINQIQGISLAKPAV